MELSLVIFDSKPSVASAQKVQLVGTATAKTMALNDAMQDATGPSYGVLQGKGVLAWARLFPELTDWEPRIEALSGKSPVTLLTLSEQLNLFAIMRWEDGRVVRQHVAFDGDYSSNGEPLGIEATILRNFRPEVSEEGVEFLSASGERYGAMQIGDALVNAILEQELGDIEEIGGEKIAQFDLVGGDSPAAEQDLPPTSASGGVQLLRTLVSKGQLELAPDANLRKLDIGMEPFLDTRRDSYEAADALIDWLIDQPGVEEVYIEPEHLAKLLAKW